jgi:chromate transporter
MVEHGSQPSTAVSLGVIAREWGRIGVTGFGGPPAHIALLRDLCVRRRGWLPESEFEDGVAATNLLPGPASTQLAIFCAWRLRGWRGAIVGGLCFIVPGLIAIIALSVFFLAAHPPRWVVGAAAGAGAAVPAVAIHAAVGLLPASWRRAASSRAARVRWLVYAAAGCAAGALVGPWLVLVLVGCGLAEAIVRTTAVGGSAARVAVVFGTATTGATWASLAWVALKVGALSYGGGFVIIPLMQHDAVHTYGWMTDSQFLTAVALGQITPGPVVQTVAVVGYAAAGVLGAFYAAVLAFTPSFVFVLAGAGRFDAIRRNAHVQAFMGGAGPAAIGAIAGAAIPLALALGHLWQYALLVGAAAWLLGVRRGVVSTIVGAAVVGSIAVLAGAPVG